MAMKGRIEMKKANDKNHSTSVKIIKKHFCYLIVLLVILSTGMGVSVFRCKAANGVVELVSGVGVQSRDYNNLNNNNYSSYWQYWSQGGSKYSGMASGGCYIVAQAKMLVECGAMNPSTSNPDDYYRWGVSNGKFRESGYVEDVNAPGHYARGINISYMGEISLPAEKNENTKNIIMQYIKNGYYVILQSNGHFAYVGRGASLAYDTPIILDSLGIRQFDWERCFKYMENNWDGVFSKLRYYKVDGEMQSGFIAPAPTIDTSFFSNIRVSDVNSNDAVIAFDTPSLPICSDVGFYISTNSDLSGATKKDEPVNNIQVKGSSYRMSKWYGYLQSNTTYYYQFFVVVGGCEYKSEINSFTTVSDTQPGDNLFSRIWPADVTETSVDLKGDLKAYHIIQDCGFQLGTSPDMSGCTTHYESEKNNVNGVTISGFGYPSQNWYGTLLKGTTYYYRLFIIEGGVTYMSSVQSFKTLGDSTPPAISSITVTEIDASGYKLSVRTIDDSGIMKVAFPTWTDTNGQDDLMGEWWNTTAVVTPDADGNYIYRVNISDHGFESGKYITHVYAYDNNMNASHSPIEVSVYPLQNIFLSETSVSLNPGDVKYVSVGLNPEYTTDTGTILCTSSDTKVATVDDYGKITAFAPGTTIITANVSGKTATCKVTVNGSGDQNETVAMLRLYNPNSGEHFYTSSEREKNALVKQGWNYEGVAWEGPAKSNTPVYRLYNPNSGDHHYTPNLSERNKLIKIGWNDEGIGWYSDDSKGSPLYRLYNPNAVTGQHHYTMDTKERDKLIRIGWKDEGIGWYGK